MDLTTETRQVGESEVIGDNNEEVWPFVLGHDWLLIGSVENSEVTKAFQKGISTVLNDENMQNRQSKEWGEIQRMDIYSSISSDL